jgi:hypothetical protein
MSILRACGRCGNELGASGGELCVGCENERHGRCRWCGDNPPTPGSELCAACETAGTIVAARGSFAATAGEPAVASISASQLGDLRDGHQVQLQTLAGEHLELAPGELADVQIETLATGRQVVARLRVDGERTMATIVPAGQLQ